MTSLWPMLAASLVVASLVGVTGLTRAPGDDMLPSLSSASTWINTRPLGPDDLRGKVVAISFWTYTCINWRRTMPYLRSWAGRYSSSGLVLIGVHSPEFAFEHNLDNVRQAVRDTGVTFPVAVDNEFAIWQAFGNQYWPALFIFDAQGRLRHRQFGEEGYDKADRVIRQLLEEAGQQLTGPATRLIGTGPEATASWENLRSPETYLGHRRTRAFASPGELVPGERRRYAVPSPLPLNSWALSGTWAAEADRVVSGAAGDRIAFRFHARDLHLVMGPEARGKPVRFRILIDGKPPVGGGGVDVDVQGRGTLRDQRMYQLVRQSLPIEDRLFEIEFLDPGAAVFAFTFG